MPGGEGSNDPIDCNTDLRRAFKDTSYTNDNNDRSASDDNPNTTNTTMNNDHDNDPVMTLVTGDGLRRRKVIRAAKETLDKGKIRFFCYLIIDIYRGINYGKMTVRILEIEIFWDATLLESIRGEFDFIRTGIVFLKSSFSVARSRIPGTLEASIVNTLLIGL